MNTTEPFSYGVGARPQFGRSLEGFVAPLREQVLVAYQAIENVPDAVTCFLQSLETHDRLEAEAAERGRWFITASLLLDHLRHPSEPQPSRALRNLGCTGLGRPEAAALEKAAVAISSLDRAAACAALPYLLDQFGKTSRLAVMRDSHRRADRNARKARGSFYTPVDLAGFMVEQIAGGGTGEVSPAEVWFDPAVGSGVFLLAVARRLVTQGGRRDELESLLIGGLFGADISPIACDFAALALTAMAPVETPLAPIFRAVRSHIAAVDSTTLQTPSGTRLLAALLPAGRPLRLICNPPYGKGAAATADAHGRLTRTQYLPFVQMTLNVAKGPSDAAAVVVPLSLGASRSAEIRRVREDIEASSAEWTFLFFDRQPHALFGEEAKTRSTVLIKLPATRAGVRSSGLLKWTSRSRPSIFDTGRAVPLGRTGIGRLVPKLGSVAEREIYEALWAQGGELFSKPQMSVAKADEIAGDELSQNVFVGGTAYNFLNVFRNYPDKVSSYGPLSASGIHKIDAGSFNSASETLALLSSLTAFWLWHVECDGFHVPRWFLEELPLWSLRFSERERDDLRLLGEQIWRGLGHDIIVSKNGGRITFAFRPSRIKALRDEVDQIILAKVGLEPRHAGALTTFEERTVSIDGADRGSRAHSTRKLAS